MTDLGSAASLDVEPDPRHEPQLIVEDAAPGPLLPDEGALGLGSRLYHVPTTTQE